MEHQTKRKLMATRQQEGKTKQSPEAARFLGTEYFKSSFHFSAFS
jgi:hypothetical protein